MLVRVRVLVLLVRLVLVVVGVELLLVLLLLPPVRVPVPPPWRAQSLARRTALFPSLISLSPSLSLFLRGPSRGRGPCVT